MFYVFLIACDISFKRTFIRSFTEPPGAPWPPCREEFRGLVSIHTHQIRESGRRVPGQSRASLSRTGCHGTPLILPDSPAGLSRPGLRLCRTCQGQDAALSSSDLQIDLSDVGFVAFAKREMGNKAVTEQKTLKGEQWGVCRHTRSEERPERHRVTQRGTHGASHPEP